MKVSGKNNVWRTLIHIHSYIHIHTHMYVVICYMFLSGSQVVYMHQLPQQIPGRRTSTTTSSTSSTWRIKSNSDSEVF